MMGLGRDDAMSMSLEEYEARLFHWNEAHSSDGPSGDAPDPERALAMIDMVNRIPALTN